MDPGPRRVRRAGDAARRIGGAGGAFSARQLYQGSADDADARARSDAGSVAELDEARRLDVRSDRATIAGWALLGAAATSAAAGLWLWLDPIE